MVQTTNLDHVETQFEGCHGGVVCSRAANTAANLPNNQQIRRSGTLQSRRRRLAAAFTLIELLLVLVILAALAAIVAPKFVHRGEESKITAAQVQINDLETALDAFDTDCGRYPTEQEGLNALAVQPGNAANWHCYYPKGIPSDPWGRPYIYRYPGQKNPNLFDLYSCGPSGVDGGEDNIGNWQKKQ